jgi:hypothetical protein
LDYLSYTNYNRWSNYFEEKSVKNVIGRTHTTGENGKWGETKQRSENQVAFNSVLGPSKQHKNKHKNS